MPAEEAVAGLWALAGGDASALGRLTLTSAEPALASSFRLGSAAQAAIEFQSERHLPVEGAVPPRGDTLMGLC